MFTAPNPRRRPPHAVVMSATADRPRRSATSPVSMTTPDSRALMPLGAWECASGSHVCMGTMAIFTPKPTQNRLPAASRSRPRGRAPGNHGAQRGQVQRAGLREDQPDADEHEHRPDGVLHQVLHAGFEARRPVRVIGNEHVGGHRGGFEPDPQVEEVRRAAQAEHGPEHRVQERVVFLLAALVTDVRPREDGDEDAEGEHRRREQQADAVELQRDDPHRDLQGSARGQLPPRTRERDAGEDQDARLTHRTGLARQGLPL